MKVTEFRKLIREEISKVLKEEKLPEDTKYDIDDLIDNVIITTLIEDMGLTPIGLTQAIHYLIQKLQIKYQQIKGENSLAENSINTYYKDLIIQQINKRLFKIFDRGGMVESEYQDLQNYLKMLDDKNNKQSKTNKNNENNRI